MEIITISSEDSRPAPLLQEYYGLVKKEFAKIPWISKLDTLQNVTSFILVEDGIFIGGVSLFKSCPEEKEIVEFKIKNIGKGGTFISTMFVGKEFRTKKYAVILLEYILKNISQICEYIWGVIENENLGLVDYYKNNIPDLKVVTMQINDKMSLVKLFR